VVACNTAASTALPALRARFADLPLLGVIEPGAEAAVAATRSGRIAVLATEATVRGGAYQRAISQHQPDANVTAVACQLLVALAEEGWTDGLVARSAVARYLSPLFESQQPSRPDTLVLGCTHFPMLRGVIGDAVGSQVAIVDSAVTTARAARALLQASGLLRTHSPPEGPAMRLLATDGAARFASVGSRFLGLAIEPGDVEIIDI
jgi:glutamate racemase